MPTNDIDYLARRAEQEVHLAAEASHPAAVSAHYRLASAYLERLHPAPEADGDRSE